MLQEIDPQVEGITFDKFHHFFYQSNEQAILEGNLSVTDSMKMPRKM